MPVLIPDLSRFLKAHLTALACASVMITCISFACAFFFFCCLETYTVAVISTINAITSIMIANRHVDSSLSLECSVTELIVTSKLLISVLKRVVSVDVEVTIMGQHPLIPHASFIIVDFNVYFNVFSLLLVLLRSHII